MPDEEFPDEELPEVPQDVYQKFSPELQLLYRHLAEGEMDTLQPGSQSDAVRAQSLRHSEETAGNSHLVVGGMSIEEWESRRSQRKIWDSLMKNRYQTN